MPTSRPEQARRVRLRPQDPFDLIRLLARSQSDPRKAVAELVQNSLDAGARRVEITWFNDEGRRALRIYDDGKGVFPELEREEALRRIARTIGHSHKLKLTPAERREQMVLGKYGIGLIGFWCVGEVLEMKSRVGGGKALVLRLREERAQGEVFPSRARLVGEEQTFTEVTVRGVHEAAATRIRPARLQAYLANELRGQLLERGAVVSIRDRVARGRARKEYVVEPRPYLGLPLSERVELEVPGFESARVELYLVPPQDERRGVVALACGGTVVLDDIAEIDGVDAPREPWCSGRLEGVIDFPELYVAPGSRRGFAHDEPVAAFLLALATLERELGQRLAGEEQRRSEREHENVAREIRRAFRSVARRLPEYDFFPVRAPGVSGAAPAEGSGGEALPRAEEEPSAAPESGEEQDSIQEDSIQQGSASDAPSPAFDGMLFPPGPLHSLVVRPRALRLAPLQVRSLQARALDADGRPCAGAVELEWSLQGAGELEAGAATARYTAPAQEPEADAPIRIRVRAVQGDACAEALVPVRIVELAGARVAGEGIPEPCAVAAPAESWRSRLREGRWEYNSAHRDYLAVSGAEPRRMRYLFRLFAKEVVLQNFGRPGDADTLERMVEVLTWLDAEGKR